MPDQVLTTLAGEPTIYCPGCNHLHLFNVNKPNDLTGARWTWDGNSEKPTFSPSMVVSGNNASARCHSFVKNGQIQFLGDCFHELKNQTVDLPPIPEWALDEE